MDKDHESLKITIGCIIGLVMVVGLLTWINASDIVQVSVELEGVRSSVEMLKCSTPFVKAECRADYDK
mgnify:FL=1